MRANLRSPETQTNQEVDHAFLRQSLKWLRAAKEQGAIKELLDDLHSYLKQHFEAEEREGGFFASVIAAAPHHAHVVDELTREHETLLVDLPSITAGLTTGPEPAPPETIRRVNAFIAAMERHEHREEGLLQTTLDRDLSVGD